MLVKLNGYNSLLIFPADLFDPISPDAAHCLGLTFRESLARTSLGQYAYCAPHNGETSYCRLSPNWKKRFRVIDRSKPRRRVNRTISVRETRRSFLPFFISISFFRMLSRNAINASIFEMKLRSTRFDTIRNLNP